MSRPAKRPLRGLRGGDTGNKRKVSGNVTDLSLKKKKYLNEEISSDEDDDDEVGKGDLGDEEEEEHDMETPDEKRRRLAKQYLNRVSQEEEEGDDVAEKLKSDRLKRAGRYYRSLRKGFSTLQLRDLSHRNCAGHVGTITCLALTEDSQQIYTGGKDNAVLCWNTETGQKEILKPGWSRLTSEVSSHDGEVLSVAVSSDNRFVASGGRDNVIRVFDRRSKEAEVQSLLGHNGAVSALAFQSGSNTLFSGSHDRTVKHWDLTSMAYIETLFGHQDAVLAMDCGHELRPVTSSNDRSVRTWKVETGSHLVFRKHSGPIDCVQYLTDSLFLSGGEDGRVNLWNDRNRSPIASLQAAHGMQADNVLTPRWICSLATARYSDTFATGSNDGFVRIWSVQQEDGKQSIAPTTALPMKGFVNAMAVTNELLIAACSREHRLGRWWSMRHSECKDRLTIVRFGRDLAANEVSSDEEDSD